jgi:hypothetical protein
MRDFKREWAHALMFPEREASARADVRASA